MKILSIIPARKNSKRLVNKNLRKLNKKTLVENSIIFAKKNIDKSKIFVSTDSDLIRKISLKNDVLCPYLRPTSLSKDKSTSFSVIKHTLKWCKKKYGVFDVIILLQPSTPFRKKKHLEEILNFFFKFKNYKDISIISMKPKYQKIKNKKKFVKYTRASNLVPTGSIYAIGAGKIEKTRTIYGKNTYGYIITSKKYNIDIDTIKDLNKAKNYLHK